MNEKQMHAAKDSMLKWLEDPHELGKGPIRSNCQVNSTFMECTTIFSDSNPECFPDGLLV